MAPKPEPVGRVVTLEAIRDRLIAELEVAEGSALASVAKQLRETLVELEQVKPAEVSAADEIAARRAVRRAADLPDAPAVGEQRRTRGSRSR